MREKIVMFSLFTFCLSITFAAHNILATTIKISFYVSPDGNDNNPGTLERPFATIQRARDAVRAINVNVKNDITVYLRGGKYYQDSAITFDERDSGPEGHRVIYTNYNGEHAQIIGGRPVTGWKHYKGNIYRAYVGTSWKFYTLFENGVRAIMARTPNNGYIRRQAGGCSRRQMPYKSGDLPESFDYRHASVYDWPGNEPWWNWVSETRKITNVDFANKIMEVELGGVGEGWGCAPGSRFFVQGSLDFLDMPGEFYLDESEGYLYYWPRSTSIESAEIIAPTTKKLIEVKGSSESTIVKNISFIGLDLFVSDFDKSTDKTLWIPQGLIYLENTQGIEIRNNRITGAGYSAIVMWHYCQNTTVYGNWIEDCGYHGVLIVGCNFGEGPYKSAEESYVNKKHLISNNYIHDFGKLIGHGSGIQIFQSGDNEISYNQISKGPRYAISQKGTLPRFLIGLKLYGTVVTKENVYDFIHSRNNVFKFNDLSDVMRDTSDGGAFESWGPGKGTLLDNNRIHDICNPLSDKVMGIYLDDDSSYYKVINNIIYNIYGAETWPMVIKGTENYVSNNIIANGNGAVGIYLGDEATNLRFTKNIFYRQAPAGYYVYMTYTWKDNLLAESDYNIIYHETGDYYVWTNEAHGNQIRTWDSWRTDKKYDQHSKIADPIFVDIANYDFTCKAGSPALANGFVNIDQKSIGMKADFPFTKPVDKMLKPVSPPAPSVPGTLIIQAENYDRMRNVYPTGVRMDMNGNGMVAYVDDGDYLLFKNVNLGKGYKIFTARYGVEFQYAGSKMEVRLDNPTGKLLGTLTTVGTGNWNTFTETSIKIRKASGVHDIYIIFKGGEGIGNIDYFKFSNITT